MTTKNIKELINGKKLSLKEMNKILPCKIILKEHQEQSSNSVDLKIKLSPRENEIVQLITKGFKNKDIAIQLEISYETVKSHRKNIFRKLEINHVNQLLHLYL